MATFDSRQLKASEGSHIPVLIKVLQATEGDVLELGTGFNSTPVLHWLCNETNRKLDSYESSIEFYAHAKNYQNDFHDVHFIEDWDALPIDKYWSVVFIDHAPGVRRVEEMIRLANNADYVIVHDTEAKSDWHYNYSKGFPNYKFRYDYTKAYPHTTILSNFKDPAELWK
jgi:hypothetical protein